MKITTEKLDEYTFLLADGVPQSVYPPPKGGYWKYMVPESEPESVLLLGIGGGTIARLIKDKYPNAKIQGVENNPEVLKMAKKLKLPKMDIAIEDAFEFVEREALNTLNTLKHYDLIIVDCWNGHYFSYECLQDNFINQCKLLLYNGGEIYINAPNLDMAAQHNLPGGLKEEIGANVIYKWKK